MGYLQFVAPLVRIRDWVTAKNHVYTVYVTVQKTTEPTVRLRAQVTVDRTRCLYTSALPERVSEITPIDYYNAVNDQ